jgi:hypothetical protein
MLTISIRSFQPSKQMNTDSQPWYLSNKHAPPPTSLGMRIVDEKQPLLTSVVVRSSNEDTKEKSQSKYTEYKPSDDYQAKVEFGSLARQMVTAGMYLSFLSGVVTICMTTRKLYYGVGIYAMLVSFLIYAWHFVTDFNKEDKSSEAFLDNRGWHPLICRILTFLQAFWLQGILSLFLSVYLFFCVQTAIAGGCFVIAGIVFLLAGIHREHPPQITGVL